jgi:N-acetylneuraminic acid mutarotase
MAQYALPPGAVRRRAVFGLLDADGWGWATVKATFWFLLIIFLEGYIPDRAYYFTVAPTVDVGFNAISPVNLCPADNKTLPCPAPAGAVIPWEQSPPTLALPAGRAGGGVFTSGETIYLIGGRTSAGATASVLTSTVFSGNLTVWAEGPALPQPRTNAAVANLSGVPYVIGGTDASGAATATVYRGVVTNGALTAWQEVTDIALPQPVTGASAASTGAGLYLFGGRTADGLSAKTYLSPLTTTGTPALHAWQELTELPLPEARADATAVSAGGAVYVLGGQGPSGPTNSVFYLGFDTHGVPKVDTTSGRVFGWGVSVGQSASAALPEARYGHTSFTNSGTIFVIGGYDANGQVVNTDIWTVPSPINGTIAAWRQLEVTDLPGPRAESAAALVGQNVFVIGGTTGGSNYEDSTVRADVAPRLPFFRLGLFGVTVPALSIKGEIGQQLGYIVAGSAALGNFTLLVVIGYMYSHKKDTYRFFKWISRGRFKPPPEDDYLT